ncbi:MAG: hypothetical protein WCE80_03985 [Acidimicrobiia bacterium]
MGRLIEELSAGPARIRVDIIGSDLPEHVLDNMDFLAYRIAQIRTEPDVLLEVPDIEWDRNPAASTVSWDGHTMRFGGDWASGPLQKAMVTLLALRLEDHGLHPFHSAAVHYRDRTILFLGGESNHGKSMCQIEACRRGGLLVSTETTVIDEQGVAVLGSKTVFLKSRAKGTERADKASPDRGAEKFFGEMPTWDDYEGSTNVDVVVVPSIDGNFETSTVEMIPFEKQYQAFHSMQNYFLLNELLAPGLPIPVVDTGELRQRRADFARRFCERPFFLIRAATPQLLLDETDGIL